MNFKTDQFRKSNPNHKPVSEIIIIGNGMVGAKLCEEMVALKLNRRYRITVFAKEPRVAYNRIKLSSYMTLRDSKPLEILPLSWYRRHGIDLLLADPVVQIHKKDKCVVSKNGRRLYYDYLVFATGSYPFVPPIEGTDLPGVFVYRTIDDLEAICRFCYHRKNVAILGGGLLGLEAAEAMMNLGLDVHVVELAAFLMPQQLTPQASEVLQKHILAQKINVHLCRQALKITHTFGKKVIHFKDGSILETDAVIISTGIRPCTQLAKDSGIECGPVGGIMINNALESSEKNIYAIGECALHRGQIYGLAAPGYKMAKMLANRFATGEDAVFEKADMSTRLKMLGVNVVTIGEHLQPVTTIDFKTEDFYRQIAIDDDRLIGALGVGNWPESGKIQTCVEKGSKIPLSKLNQFKTSGALWPNEEKTGPAAWNDDAYICNCLQISKGTVCRTIEQGSADLDDLVRQTKASSVCGSCRPLLAQLLGTPVGQFLQKGWKPLLIISILALVLACVNIFYPPFTMADSVESFRFKIDALWRNKFFKQVSGFSLLGLSLIGLLLSLRKRFPGFSFGHIRSWRIVHALFGVTSLIVLFAHTGFHFGRNLNYWLMLVFVVLNLLGAVAGIVAAIESKGQGFWVDKARKLRPVLTTLHIVLFWPLPVLLTFHILSVYFY
ncbi:MAG: FAD-dependent oxidoreductase [Candidatus Omnitrophota bacterium]